MPGCSYGGRTSTELADIVLLGSRRRSGRSRRRGTTREEVSMRKSRKIAAVASMGAAVAGFGVAPTALARSFAVGRGAVAVTAADAAPPLPPRGRGAPVAGPADAEPDHPHRRVGLPHHCPLPGARRAPAPHRVLPRLRPAAGARVVVDP